MSKRRNTRILCAGILAALFAVQLGMHLNADNLLLDDWVFEAVRASGQSVRAFLAERWQGWSSRLLIEGLLSYTTHSIWLWRVCDSLMMALMAFSLARLAACEDRPWMLALCAMLVTTIPFAVLRSTGWQATSLNYYWPLACTLAALVPLADALWKRRTGRAWQALSLPCALLGANQEQTAAVLVGAYLVLGIALIVRDRRIAPLLPVVFAIAAAELCLHLICPGNALRAQQSVALVNLRDYGQFALIDRLSIGLTSTSALLLFTWCPVMVADGACVIASVVSRRRGIGFVLLAALPLAFALFAVFAPEGLSGWAAAEPVMQVFERFGTYVLLMGPEYAMCGGHAAMMTGIVCMLGLMALSLYLSIGHRPLAACAVFAFALGFAARMALSFSPTVVESGERTMLPLYGAMMLCAVLSLRDVRAEGGRRWPVAVAFFCCAVLAAVNVAGSFLLAA